MEDEASNQDDLSTNEEFPSLLPNDIPKSLLAKADSSPPAFTDEVHPTRHPTTLNDKAVLVDNFVPDHIRAVNERMVSAPFFAVGNAVKFTGRFHGAVNFLPPQHPIVPEIPTYPNRFVYPDIHYAVKQRVSCRPPSSSEDATPPTSLSSVVSDSVSAASSTGATEPTKSIDSTVTNTLDAYTNKWEKIIDMERKELLLRYEKYSQYIIMATVPQKNTAAPRASLIVPGIADASPPLQIGDIVLLRPLHLLSIPIVIDNCPTWSPPHHVVEIRASVIQVIRNADSKQDSVHITWLDAEQAKVLKMSMGHQQKSQRGGPLRKVGPFNVRFVPSTNPMVRSLTAMDWLGDTFRNDPTSFANLMFPVEAPTVPHHDQNVANATAHLNHQQAEFVHMVIARTMSPSTTRVRSPMILTGPAGTGKTKTMLSAIFAVLDLKTNDTHRSLICTPSHTAADVVTRRLGERLKPNELLRLYDSDRPVETVPVEVLPFCSQNAVTGAFEIPKPFNLLKYQTIVCTCYDAHLLYGCGLANQQLRVQRQCLSRHLQQTYAGSNLSINIEGVNDPHFTHLFIDEASQAGEPETIIPLSVVLDVEDGVRKVEICLTGDPKQLSPAVFSSEAAKLGLECSWMERLLLQPAKCLGGGKDHMLGEDIVNMEDWIRYSMLRNGQERLSTFLTLNYRGHPSFLMMPSALFYADKLHGYHSHEDKDASFWCQKLRLVEALSNPVILTQQKDFPEEFQAKKEFQWPIHFRSVFGKDQSITIDSGVSGSSWANRMEAEAVAEIVATLVANHVKTQSIGVMAPFRGQVVMIRGLLRKQSLGSVNVGTVEDYQAVEKEVIVLSFTRSNSSFTQYDVENRLGLFGQPKRSNVAMTRAECLFITVGNPQTMALDVVWQQFLLFCQRNGLYYGHATDASDLQPDPATSKSFHPNNKKLTLISTLEKALRRS